MADVTAFTRDEADLAASVRQCLMPSHEEPPTAVMSVSLDRDAWARLAELGLWSIADEADEGAAGLMVAAGLEVGRSLLPGPVAATLAAVRALPPGQADELIEGRRLAVRRVEDRVPWGGEGPIVIDRDGSTAVILEIVTADSEVQTLGGEPWVRAELRPVLEVEDASDAWNVHDLLVAARVLGAATHSLDQAILHAGTRHQFGRAIGANQAVSHPLVDAKLSLSSSVRLLRAAAGAADDRHPTTDGLVAAAVGSATRSALTVSAVAHQVMGAMGYTLEGPIAQATRMIRHEAVLARSRSDGARALDLYQPTLSTRKTDD